MQAGLLELVGLSQLGRCVLSGQNKTMQNMDYITLGHGRLMETIGGKQSHKSALKRVHSQTYNPEHGYIFPTSDLTPEHH